MTEREMARKEVDEAEYRFNQMRSNGKLTADLVGKAEMNWLRAIHRYHSLFSVNREGKLCFNGQVLP